MSSENLRAIYRLLYTLHSGESTGVLRAHLLITKDLAAGGYCGLQSTVGWRSLRIPIPPFCRPFPEKQLRFGPRIRSAGVVSSWELARPSIWRIHRRSAAGRDRKSTRLNSSHGSI